MNLSKILGKINSEGLAKEMNNSMQLAQDLLTKLPPDKRGDIQELIKKSNKQLTLLKEKGVDSPELSELNDLLMSERLKHEDEKK